ncbi:hypothetical protein K435DRAFT_905359, partial [Dendrothele bispora CBS 962.96]
IQGVGGGGVIQLTLITFGDIVTLEERPKRNIRILLSAVFGVASVIGPLIDYWLRLTMSVVGGVFSDRVSWRWAFLITWNLPTNVDFSFFFEGQPPPHKTLRQYVDEFDFLGLFLIMAGVICLLVGFLDSNQPLCKTLMTVDQSR